jgi:type VI secretion system protein ImpA
MGRITFQQVLLAKDKTKAEGDAAKAAASGPSLSQIQAAFRDAGPEPAAAALAFVNEAIGHARGLETFLDSTLGVGRGVNFESLNKLLVEMQQTVAPFAGNGAPTTEAAAAGGAQAASAPPPPRASGRIESPADVLKALESICEYYRQKEPSSPVPLILERAQRLVDKNFTEILNELTPDALKQLQMITGQKSEKE